MFLIYNFNLYEDLFSYIKSDFLIYIESNFLKRKINEQDKYFMSVYGMEAFCLSSLICVDDYSLKRNWRRMNNLYNILTISDFILDDCVELEVVKANKLFSLKKYPNYSASIDKIINILKSLGKNSANFSKLVKNVCPFLIMSIEKNF